MPADVRAVVLAIQTDLKIKKGNGKISQQIAITHIIRDYVNLKKDFKKQP